MSLAAGRDIRGVRSRLFDLCVFVGLRVNESEGFLPESQPFGQLQRAILEMLIDRRDELVRDGNDVTALKEAFQLNGRTNRSNLRRGPESLVRQDCSRYLPPSPLSFFYCFS